ncbi:hypothetical protein GGI25_001941 [Coemansia spiralis]|uniref:Uncharacterized protein n=2 Tax=Coemansia TaxID=4863 RepID=A0A9W8KZ08_9FUNG|nr:hypothetical protein EDC05_002236 [Coemansia umbellata]KAJ2623478.1 hypothetical protein GGI26_002317 [Coemansia sp. RSA 1358]KAJ2678952.1 hypothetical protein GGI25_001941 [Coemansia spiralis]
MNFFRKRARRDVLASATESDKNSLYSVPLAKDQLISNKPKRHSYFSIRRRDVPEVFAIAPAVKTVPLASADPAAEAGDELDVPQESLLHKPASDDRSGIKAPRRRSMLGISYLINKRSGQKELVDVLEITPPETAITRENVHQKRSSSVGRERQQRLAARRNSDCGSNSSRTSSDESSGGDSDDTLATRDTEDLVAAFTDITPSPQSTLVAQSPSSIELQSAGTTDQTLYSSSEMLTASDGLASTSSASTEDCVKQGAASACVPDNDPHSSSKAFYMCRAVEEASSEHPHKQQQLDPVLLRASTLPTSTKPVSTAVVATATTATGAVSTPNTSKSEGSATVPQRGEQRRKQLKLGRLRAREGPITNAKGNSSGSNSNYYSSSNNNKSHCHQLLLQRTVFSAVRATLANMHNGQSIHSEISSSKRIELAPDSVRVGSLSIGPKAPQVDEGSKTRRKLSGGGIGRLFSPPPPSAIEQAKMDAWAADNDEFSAEEYDLSGVYFELPSPEVLGAEAAAASRKYKASLDTGKSILATPVINTAQVDDQNVCVPKGSRLSSTSTVVEESALSPQQYKRVYVSSVRKLQWQSSGRGMACILHIKNTMTKANENYVVVSGGRNLDAYNVSRDKIAELYVHGGYSPLNSHQYQEGTVLSQASRRRGMAFSSVTGTSVHARSDTTSTASAAATVTAAAVAYPERIRSASGANQALLRTLRDGQSSHSHTKQQQLTLTDSIADAAPAVVERMTSSKKGPASDCELDGFGKGDLVSLSPADGDSDVEMLKSSEVSCEGGWHKHRRHRRRKLFRQAPEHYEQGRKSEVPATAAVTVL